MKKCQGYLVNWMALWYFVFPLAVYLNPSKDGTSNVFYLGVLLPWVILLLMGQVKLWNNNAVYLSALLMFFYLWLSSLWAGGNSYTDIVYLFKWFVYALCLLTAPVLITHRYPKFFETLLLFVFAAAVIAAALTIYVHIQTHGASFSKVRMSGWGHGYNSIGLGLHHGIAVLIGLFLVDRHKSKAIWFGLLSLIPLLAVMLTHSRGPMLALVVCGFIAVFLFEHTKAVVVTKVTLLALALIAVTFIGWEQLFLRGFSGRLDIWEKVWRLAADSMVWGEGYSLEASRVLYHGTPINHSHNVVLELLRYGGLVAVLLFMGHAVSLCRFQLKFGDRISGYYFLVLLFTGMVMMVNGWYILDRPNYYWLGYWYPIGLLMVKQNTQANRHLAMRQA